ncbi:hypothetical protein [Stenotrophomonas sp.]|uniref:hypothetical protein n=1 Tax=Stenotrophomonas sp. TaxID=69392 RepID=UPI0028962CFA|nr:hypothetical protein [Stenotrophomonas sp.]
MKFAAFQRVCVGLAMMAALTGCVSLPPQQAYNRDATPPIKTIVVLPVTPIEPNVLMMNHPGANFGLIGGLVAAANMASKRDRLQAACDAARFDPAVYFKESLTQRMAERGYTLVWPGAMVEPKGSKTARGVFGLRKAYTHQPQADAQLDLSVNFVGYAAAGAGDDAPYRPMLSVAARLVSQDGKQNYFTDFVVYNNVLNQAKVITLEPEAQRFAYADFDALEDAGAETVEGIKLAIDRTSDALVRQL